MTNFQNTNKIKKNDDAWENLFGKYDILNIVQKEGYFKISSQQINEFRESRLMAKFDREDQLPKIFKNNQLSILPISRSEYVIGYFDTHLKVNYDQEIKINRVAPPTIIKSIDYKNIYSESIAVNFAFNVGIIADLLDVDQESCYYTLSGRMSTGKFEFKIKNKTQKDYYQLSVDNSQCEIDAGFETENSLAIIEVKHLVEDFLIRQLYYPYRLWTQKINKKVIPILMTYSNNLFNFFVYNFQDPSDYNSIELVKQFTYQISPVEDTINSEDIIEVFNKIKIQESKNQIPFPQADLFSRVVDLLDLLKEEILSNEQISNYYEFDLRQAQYYSSAAKYLGLIEKDKINKQTKYWKLTDEGLSIVNCGYRKKILRLIEKILEHQIFYETFKISLDSGEIPKKEKIIEIMSFNLEINRTSIDRRASTVRGWIKWIRSQITA